MAEWSVSPTLDLKISGSDPAGSGIQLMTVQHFIAQFFIIILP